MMPTDGGKVKPPHPSALPGVRSRPNLPTARVAAGQFMPGDASRWRHRPPFAPAFRGLDHPRSAALPLARDLLMSGAGDDRRAPET
jgi:hypothetical protein